MCVCAFDVLMRVCNLLVCVLCVCNCIGCTYEHVCDILISVCDMFASMAC